MLDFNTRIRLPVPRLQLLNTKESTLPWIAVGVLGDVDVVRTHVGIQVFQSEPRSTNVVKK